MPARERIDRVGNAKHLVFPRVYANIYDKIRRGKFKLGRKTSPEEVQTEDGGYAYMTEAYPKSYPTESVVEDALG